MAAESSDSSSFEDLTGAVEQLAAEERSDEPNAEIESEWQDVIGSGHILRKIIKEGASSELKLQKGDVCIINLTGRLKNGQIIEEKEKLEINASDGDVIQGVDLVLPLMQVGEVSEIQISSRFGYGENGLLPDIPPLADLVYTVELVSFTPEPEMENLSIKERQEIGNRKRERGNWWFNLQDPMMAIQCYRKAIEYLDESTGGITDPTPDGDLPRASPELISLIEDRMKAYNNMAAAQLKQGLYDAALSSVDIVLTCQPQNVKALFRKGKILSHKNNIPEALKTVRAAYNLSPEDRAIRTELTRLEEREKRDSQKERDLARKMLGAHTGGTKNGKGDRSKKSSGKKMLVWGSLVFSIAIGVISVAAYKYKLV